MAMNDFFSGLNYGQFLRSISTVSKKDMVNVVTELGLGTSNSPKNLQRLYSAVMGAKKIKEEPVDYLVNAIFVSRLSGGETAINEKYKGLFVDLLEHFKIPHQAGFIGEEEEKRAVKRFKKIKAGHLEKYLKNKLNEDNRFEYLLIFRYLANYRKLPVFEQITEKNAVLRDIISE
jgi:hypothetical protein